MFYDLPQILWSQHIRGRRLLCIIESVILSPGPFLEDLLDRMVFPRRAIHPQACLTADVLLFTEVEAVPSARCFSAGRVGGRHPYPVTLHISFVTAELRCHNFQEDVTLSLSLPSFSCLNSTIFVSR